jgi:hypothetical protein
LFCYYADDHSTIFPVTHATISITASQQGAHWKKVIVCHYRYYYIAHYRLEKVCPCNSTMASTWVLEDARYHSGDMETKATTPFTTTRPTETLHFPPYKQGKKEMNKQNMQKAVWCSDIFHYRHSHAG